MAIPYPLEIETGELHPGTPRPRIAFDVEAAVEAAIRADGSDIELFGVRYPAEDAATAAATVERCRNLVTLRFNERISAPDADLWLLFANQAHAQLGQHHQLDDGVLDVLRLTIDNI